MDFFLLYILFSTPPFWTAVHPHLHTPSRHLSPLSSEAGNNAHIIMYVEKKKKNRFAVSCGDLGGGGVVLSSEELSWAERQIYL